MLVAHGLQKQLGPMAAAATEATLTSPHGRLPRLQNASDAHKHCVTCQTSPPTQTLPSTFALTRPLAPPMNTAGQVSPLPCGPDTWRSPIRRQLRMALLHPDSLTRSSIR